MWPERPDVTDTWPMAVLAQEIDPMIQEDLVLVRDITIDKIGFELEGDATPLVENLLLNTCLADPSIRPSPPFQELDIGEVYRDAPYVESEEDRKMLGLRPNPRDLVADTFKGAVEGEVRFNFVLWATYMHGYITPFLL